MINVRLNTTQWKKIGTKLDRMASRAEKSGNAAAIGKAATPMLAAAKQKSPSKRVAKSLVKRVKRQSDGIVVGKIAAKKKSLGIGLLHLLEFGHNLVKGSKKSGNRKIIGFVPAKPFLRPAYYQTRDESKEIYKREIWADIQKHVRKERDKAGI